MRGGGIVWNKLRIRINYVRNRMVLLHNPSVTATPCQLPLHKGASSVFQNADLYPK